MSTASRRLGAKVLVLALLCLASQARAQAPNQPPAGPSVGFNGSLGTKAALLVIDGNPRTVQVGATVDGVRLVSIEDGQATIEVGGRRKSLQLGATHARIGGSSTSGRQIVMSVGEGGHFRPLGTINGHSVRFLVDTGASSIALGATDARRMNLRIDATRVVEANTANGVARGYIVTLDSVRIGDVEVRRVDAIVLPVDMPYILLGNTFLNRFQMKRENDLLTLDLRY